MTRWVSEAVIIRETNGIGMLWREAVCKDSEMSLDEFDVYCPSSYIVYCFPLSFLVVFVHFAMTRDPQHVAHLHIFVSLPIVYRIEMDGSLVLAIDTLRVHI